MSMSGGNQNILGRDTKHPSASPAYFIDMPLRQSEQIHLEQNDCGSLVAEDQYASK